MDSSRNTQVSKDLHRIRLQYVTFTFDLIRSVKNKRISYRKKGIFKFTIIWFTIKPNMFDGVNQRNGSKVSRPGWTWHWHVNCWLTACQYTHWPERPLTVKGLAAMSVNGGRKSIKLASSDPLNSRSGRWHHLRDILGLNESSTGHPSDWTRNTVARVLEFLSLRQDFFFFFSWRGRV